MQRSECEERIETFASPPYFSTLLNLNVHVFCKEVQWNLDTTSKPLYKEVLRMTNDFLNPSNSKIDEKEPRYNETSL